MARPPTYDLAAYSYCGVVRHPFCSPVYTQPWPYGEKVGFSFRAGDIIEDLLEFQLSSDGKFVAARITLVGRLAEDGRSGWVNVWRLNTGRRGPTGMFFIDVLGTERKPAIAWQGRSWNNWQGWHGRGRDHWRGWDNWHDWDGWGGART